MYQFYSGRLGMVLDIYITVHPPTQCSDVRGVWFCTAAIRPRSADPAQSRDSGAELSAASDLHPARPPHPAVARVCRPHGRTRWAAVLIGSPHITVFGCSYWFEGLETNSFYEWCDSILEDANICVTSVIVVFCMSLYQLILKVLWMKPRMQYFNAQSRPSP